MAEALADAAGSDAPRPFTTGEYRLDDVRHNVASPLRAERELGFSAEEDFAAGMSEFAAARRDERPRSSSAASASSHSSPAA